MARKYAIQGKTPAGTNLTILELVGATTVRPKLYDIIVGSPATPADVATDFELIRGTVAGTGTAVTPRALDPGDPAALASGQAGTFTGQTKTSNSSMLDIPLNQRATFRWVAAPGGEILVPATASNFVALESIASGGTPQINCTMHYEE